MLLRTIFLVVVLLLIYYIYDRNIIILDNLNLDSLHSIIETLFSYLDNFFNNLSNEYNTSYSKSENNSADNNEGFKNNTPSFKIKLKPSVYSKLPEITCLPRLFKKLYKLSKKYNNETMEYNTGLGVRLEYYFTVIQNQCTAVYNDDKPNLQMSYMLDIQHKILKIIHDFIFITPGSNLPDELQKLEDSFKECFHKINSKLTSYNNKKFVYSDKNNKKINTNSGFIEHPDEPQAKNTFYDNYGFY